MAKALVWKLEPALHAFVGSVQWLEISIHEAMAMNECQMTTLASLCRDTGEAAQWNSRFVSANLHKGLRLLPNSNQV